MNGDYQIAAYYFPNYHVDPLNEKWHGKGWTEWELVKAARPRFPGHRQPKVPVWGYEDEADPGVMAKKIDAAADHGVDCFIFDWYWYDDHGAYLHRALEEGFLRAPNNDRLKFAIMWANHDWLDIQPAQRNRPYNVLAKGAVTPETFQAVLERVKAYLDRTGLTPPMFTVYAWNEWTEGGYLEPDTVHGMKYLEALKQVFPPGES